jgi:ankyrin repeat protein
MASYEGHAETLALLLANGADVNAAKEVYKLEI